MNIPNFGSILFVRLEHAGLAGGCHKAARRPAKDETAARLPRAFWQKVELHRANLMQVCSCWSAWLYQALAVRVWRSLDKSGEVWSWLWAGPEAQHFDWPSLGLDVAKPASPL